MPVVLQERIAYMLGWQREFLRLLFHPSLERMDIEAAHRLKDGHIPPRLYKYRTFDSCHHINALKSGILFASRPCNFNDPFDSAVLIEPSISDFFDTSAPDLPQVIAANWRDPLVQELTKAIQRREASANFSQEIICALRSVFDQRASALSRDTFMGMRELTDVISFSSKKLNFLMWSHYADSHRGFCIEYDTGAMDTSSLLRRLAFPVIYTQKLRKLSKYLLKGGSSNNLWLFYASMIKLDHWSYESEWRIILPILDPAQSKRAVKVGGISKLIAGAAMSDQDYFKLSAIAEEIGAEIERLELDIRSGSLREVER